MALDGSTLPWATDQDARGLGTALASASLWDNGDDPVRALEDLLLVRRQALMAFGPDRLAEGEPLSKLTQVYVPVHLHHRYQLEAAAKLIGGLDYAHELACPGPRASPRCRRRLSVSHWAPSQALRQEITVPVQALPWLVPRPGRRAAEELFEGASARASTTWPWPGRPRTSPWPLCCTRSGLSVSGAGGPRPGPGDPGGDPRDRPRDPQRAGPRRPGRARRLSPGWSSPLAVSSAAVRAIAEGRW